MYEKLTSILPLIDNKDFGQWFVDRINDGSPEHPFQMPFVAYDHAIINLEEAILAFMNEHPEMELPGYGEILKRANIEWNTESMTNADVSALDGKTTIALLVGAIRADRFYEGALLEFCKNGSIAKWLSHLQEIDRKTE